VLWWIAKCATTIIGIEFCSIETGGGVCPDGNTCCLTKRSTSGCIPNDMGSLNATCCDDMETGCPVGYNCITSGCVVDDTLPYQDKLVAVLPRYQLCEAEEIRSIYGLSIDDASGAKLAYYSSRGSLLNPNSTKNVRHVLIVIHGANRNADDYFCSAKAALKLENATEESLVIAPVFYSIADFRQDASFLAWADDKDGAWRFGADSLVPIQKSSFSALDTLVQTILSLNPSILMITIAGHSSGGQTVQRWSLLTPVWSTSKMRAIVANPSSFAYLSPLRYLNGSYKLPRKELCPHYNQWEWGLDSGGSYSVPYRDEQMENNSSLVIDRFRHRDIVYLSGELDRCNVSDPGWCNSHGLETTCMDQFQGSNRFERSMRYMESLQDLGFAMNKHRHIVIPCVGHDHSLMFQSKLGRRSLLCHTCRFRFDNKPETT
jgi:pimeloyl-ACP methyl ester carboxylesterase